MSIKFANIGSKINMTQVTGRAAAWQFLGGGWQTSVRLIASIFLARALTPEDFGVFAMALLVNSFLESIGALGMGAGIIAKKEVTHNDLCTSFWTMASMRIFMFFMAFISAPIAGLFFNDPRVTNILRVISFLFLISILSVVSQTIVTKNLQFRSLNIIRGGTVVLESSIAVLLATMTGLGYWSLVYAMFANAIVSNISIFYLAKWRPSFCFNKESFQYLFRYGINSLGFSIMNYLKQNIDYLLVGRLLGTSSLGLYEFAYRIPHLIQTRISQPVGAVVFPAFSKVQDDNQRLAQGYIQVVKYVSLVTFPLLFGLASVAHLAVPVLWGNQWLEVITPLRVLCFCALLRIIPQPVGAIFNCKNRPDLPFKFASIGLIWAFFTVGLFGYFYGILGVAFGMVLSIAPGYLAVFTAFRILKQKIYPLFNSLRPILLSSIVSALSAYSLALFLIDINISPILTLFASILTGGLVYFSSLFFLFRNVFQELIRVFEEVLGKKLTL